jgi:hypothetical protein
VFYSRSIPFVVIGSLAGTVALAGSPVVYWKCDPVGPDETLLLLGEGLGPQVRVRVASLADVEPSTPEKPRANFLRATRRR